MISNSDLWPHQRIAANAVMRGWVDGIARRQCLVMPTGAGKTRVAAEITRRAISAGLNVMAFAHRTEIVAQLQKRLPQCGVAGTAAPVWATTYQGGTSVHIASKLGNDGIVIVDECHHLPIDQAWAREIAELFGENRWLGLTATPQRADGKPLSGTFDRLIVGAHYSDLIADGRIVPCRAYCPPQQMGKDMALCPLVAYKRYARDQQTFVFVSRKEQSDSLAAQFRDAGIAAASITADTRSFDRMRAMAEFKSGAVTVLVSVYTLTEGVDVPSASCAILARNFAHASTYLQAVGRIIRAAPGKSEATIVDLCGSVLRHGLPTTDRVYSLDSGIAPSPSETAVGLIVCRYCGATYEAGPRNCVECGEEQPCNPSAHPRIWSLELAEVYSGSDTNSAAKTAEFVRLKNLASDRGWGLDWVAKEYSKLFGHPPLSSEYTADDKRNELVRLRDIAKKRGYRKGYSYVRYKNLFGHQP